MADENYWLLPDGINEALPDEAEHLDSVSRRLLDNFKTWGYRPVMPPMVEFLESLHTGTGSKLDLQMFKITDQISGRMMGIRADITPQVARIDAHEMSADQPNRLCYIGNVLRSRSNHLFQGNRSPMQVGAELFGHEGLNSDAEIITLMLDMIRQCSSQALLLGLGHVGIYRSIVAYADLDEEVGENYRDKVKRKSIPEIEEWLESPECEHLAEQQKRVLRCLPELNGKPESVIADARKHLGNLEGEAGQNLLEQLDYIEQLVESVHDYDDNVTVYLDLTELRGYAYHTGVMFEAYVEGGKRDIARGGRYDGIGKYFGNARPATGFSADLRLIAALEEQKGTDPNAIYAPVKRDASLLQLIKTLRTQGECVVSALETEDSYAESAAALGCKRHIVHQDGNWVVADLSD